MKNWLWFAFATIVFWGAYVPTIHAGQMNFGSSRGPIRAFLFVGVAYFLVAVLIPAGLLYAKWEPAEFPMKGVALSTFAGILGALGALGIILAFLNGGDPKVVPPLVFAGAPIMSVFVNVAMNVLEKKPIVMPQWQFVVGIVLAAAGAALVLKFKPV